MPEEALGGHGDTLLAVLQGSRIGVLATDAAGTVAHANTALWSRTGFAADELIGLPLAELPIWRPSPLLGEQFGQALAKGESWQGQLELRHKDGHLMPSAADLLPIPLPLGGIGGIGGFLLLLHGAPMAEPPPTEALPAAFDRLTGLPGEPVFRKVLRDSVERARLTQQPLTIARVDIDQFKQLNEGLGTDGADGVLVEVAQRLSASIRREDMVARLNGDEFGLLMGEAASEPAPLDRILAAISKPMTVAGHPLAVTVSIGSASFPADGETADELISAADAAVADAKRKGRNQISHARPSSCADRGFGRRQILAGLRQAIDSNELVLHYQPQLNLFSGEIVGAEALLRWAHPEQGLIPPMQFIPLAEESGLIIPISEWVLDRACAQAAAWRAAGLPPLRMAVNISARHFRFLDLIETVRGALQRSGLEPRHLEIELTESAMMHDVSAAMRVVDALKAIGLRISLDDFGTGHSSLAYLSRFDIDALKIDQSFVRDVTTNAVNASIVSATIAMAHKLGKSVIAEGVETAGQMHFLRGRECDEMQGFLFSPALPAAEFEARLARGDRLELQAARTRAGSNRLLIVDDEPNILSALRRLLRHEGYEIHTAASGTEALELLAIEPIQVVVSDQRMPGMSGTEFLGHVNSMYPQTVRIALSGYADLTAVTEAVNQGAIYRFLSKPWNDEDLKGALQAAFRHWRAKANPPEVQPADLETVDRAVSVHAAPHGAPSCGNR
ncbi:EAL domain-containing protein [Ideonella sp. A 288]|uniref:EAL domain-containing protein n=1 Tax=Ideonella sp. A 288 TaxID=1962181 RepID=UPI000B4B2C2D|nr:EAL domain-containing protein [Ideonella sp. A 288]